MADERIPPIKLTDNETGKTYELDFSRDSIRFAEARGFKLDSVIEYPVTNIPEFFYLAFRKNHKEMARSQVDVLFTKLGGMTGAMMERLNALYNQAALSNTILTDEEAEKNAAVTVEL